MAELTHVEKEKQVFEFFNGTITRELNVVSLRDKATGFDMIPLRVQMVLTFSLVDILANFWFEFRGVPERGTRNKFQAWYDQYCRTERNVIYARRALWHPVSSQRIYDLRNAMVHFFALPQTNDTLNFSLVSNELPEADYVEMQGRLNRGQAVTVIIKPREFHELVRKGGVLMLEEWTEMIRDANQGNSETRAAYIAGIDRLWQRTRLEGAVEVVKPR